MTGPQAPGRERASRRCLVRRIARSDNANFIDLWTTPSGGQAYALDEDLETVRILRWGATRYTTVKVGD